MSDLLKLIFVSIGYQLIFNLFNFIVIYSKLKTGVYKLPFFQHIFQSWVSFGIAAWFFNATFYLIATVLAIYTYVLCARSSGYLMPALIIGQMASIIVSGLFMRLIVGETLTRDGWIAFAFALAAIFFAVHSGKNA